MTKTKTISPLLIRNAPTRQHGPPTELTSARRSRCEPRRTAASRESKRITLARRDALVLEHLGLVKVIARSVHDKLPASVELDDLVQAGVIGLLDAAKKFDLGRQAVFSVYAKHRIRGAIVDSLRQLDWASRDIRQRHKELEAAKHNLAGVLQRVPTEDEVAAKLGVNMTRLRVIMLNLKNIGLISADTRAEHYDRPPDLPAKSDVQPDFICIRRELRTTIGDAMRTLSERHRRVVLLYYFLELKMTEIGGILGINESRVSQILKLALDKLAIVLQNCGIESIHAFHN